MKILPRKFLFLLPLLLILPSLHAQEDSSKMDYIYLGKYRPGDEVARQPWEDDFMRNRVLIRVNLFHPANAPLQEIETPIPFQELCPGLPGLVLSAMLHHQMPANHPADPSRSIDYVDLIQTLVYWQGLSAESDQSISGQTVGLEWMLPAIDLIADKRFSSQTSREQYRIQYIRVIWHNPNLSLGPRAVLMVPYDRIRPYLLRFDCPPGPGSPVGISVAEFLERGYVVGQALRLPDDPVIVLPFKGDFEGEAPEVDWER